MPISLPKILLTIFFFYSLGVIISSWKHLQTPSLAIVFCDVGQGDATIIMDGSRQILIDGGPDLSILQCLSETLPFGDRHLDLVVLTHPDNDHLAGLNGVLRAYTVDTLLVSSVPKAGFSYSNFYNLVFWQQQTRGLKVETPMLAQNWCLSPQVCCQVISDHPQILPEYIWQKKYLENDLLGLITKYVPKNYNYNGASIVLNCQVDDKKLTLTGDIEKDQELALITQGMLTKVDILKIPHHGSKTSSSLNFLQILQPEESIIICGQNNPYGHPHSQTLNNLEQIQTRLWRTDQQGTIRFFKLNKADWVISTSSKSSLSDW
jgi:competence protein ComEC